MIKNLERGNNMSKFIITMTDIKTKSFGVMKLVVENEYGREDYYENIVNGVVVFEEPEFDDITNAAYDYDEPAYFSNITKGYVKFVWEKDLEEHVLKEGLVRFGKFI